MLGQCSSGIHINLLMVKLVQECQGRMTEVPGTCSKVCYFQKLVIVFYFLNGAFRRREEEVSEEIAEMRRQRHCQAQACYRNANQTVLRMQSWEDRLVSVAILLTL